MHFDFKTPKGLETSPSDEKKKERRAMGDKRVEEKKLPFFLIVVSSTLEDPISLTPHSYLS